MRFNFIRVWGGFWSIMPGDLFYPQKTGQITGQLYTIQDRDINLFLYSDGQSTLCIDAGYINNDYLKNEFEKVNLDPASITHLFLTHTDMDHAGGIDRSSKTTWFKNAKVYMGRDEEDMINGNTPRKFIFSNPVEITREYTLLQDGDVVHVGAAIVQAIATPGHTPGHMSYLINSHILCTGDAVVLKNGKIEPFYRTWNMDHEAAKQSVKKLAAFENISILCTAHTGCSLDFEGVMEQWRQ